MPEPQRRIGAVSAYRGVRLIRQLGADSGRSRADVRAAQIDPEQPSKTARTGSGGLLRSGRLSNFHRYIPAVKFCPDRSVLAKTERCGIKVVVSPRSR